MANDVKWIRIKVDMFEGDSFKRVKRAEIDGVINFRDKLTAVWFELMLLAGKVNNNGYFFNDEVSYNTYEDLAIMIDRTTKEVEMCVSWFIKNRMIDENPFIITNFTKYQNNAGLEKIREQGRLRQQQFREKRKNTLILPQNDVTLHERYGNALPLKDNNNSYSYSLKDLNNKPNTNNTIIKEHINIIIEYLNIKAKKRFKVVESNAKFIRARFEEGYTVEDLKQVIDTKVADWLDTEQAKYLRPETLFNATKFQSYINQKPKERVEEKNVPTNRY